MCVLLGAAPLAGKRVRCALSSYFVMTGAGWEHYLGCHYPQQGLVRGTIPGCTDGGREAVWGRYQVYVPCGMGSGNAIGGFTALLLLAAVYRGGSHSCGLPRKGPSSSSQTLDSRGQPPSAHTGAWQARNVSPGILSTVRTPHPPWFPGLRTHIYELRNSMYLLKVIPNKINLPYICKYIPKKYISVFLIILICLNLHI